MKKIFAILMVTSVFFSFSVSAQQSKMVLPKQTLMDSLKISETVADSVIAIRTQTMSEMKTVMSDQSLSQDQRKEKMKPIKQEMKTQLKKFLTDDQIAKLQEMQMAQRQNKQE